MQLEGMHMVARRCLLFSQVGQYFDINARKSTFTQELRAGTVTFLTVSPVTIIISRVYTILGTLFVTRREHHFSASNRPFRYLLLALSLPDLQN